MFGTFRLVLAIMVVVTHIGGVEVVGGIAVWGFFMLSGFLMTGVLNRKYGFSSTGIGRFALSRAARLYPAYWVSVLLTLGIIGAFTWVVDPQLINEAMVPPQSAREVLSNLFIFGHTIFGMGRIERALSPSAWAIDVEMLMYICSCLFLARSARAAKWSTLVLVALFPLHWYVAKRLMAQGYVEYGGQLIYSFLPAALLPYSMGSWLWNVRGRFKSLLLFDRRAMGLTSAIGVVACGLLVSKVSVTLAYLGSLPFLAVLLMVLSRVNASQRASSIDEFAGWMSYPVYLLHFVCAYIVVLATGTESTLLFFDGRMIRFTASGFVAVLGVTLAMTAIFAALIEAPLERWRRRSISYSRQGRSREDGTASVS